MPQVAIQQHSGLDRVAHAIYSATVRNEKQPDFMADLKQLEASLDLTFRNHSLLKQALVHRSYLNENPAFPLPSNLARALEAVVGAVMLDHGLRAARKLVLRLFAADLATLRAGQ